jgi:hypothetical protein
MSQNVDIAPYFRIIDDYNLTKYKIYLEIVNIKYDLYIISKLRTISKF